MRTAIVSVLFSLLMIGQASAETHIIKLLNKGSDGQKMVFEPALLNVKVGDVIKFHAITAAHKVNQYKDKNSVPAGSAKWPKKMKKMSFKKKGKPEDTEGIKIDKEGVFLYYCKPHHAMGMVGAIVAGKPTNLAAVKTVKVKPKKARKRMEAILAKIK